MAPGQDITLLLGRWQDGDKAALEDLSPYIYEELRKLAANHMRRERAGHTLQATALVHEAYIRLLGVDTDFSSRSHFYALASRLMRRVLVDHARAARRDKRGGGAAKQTLNESRVEAGGREHDILELDDALNKLAEIDARMARGVELQYFGGLTSTEAAEVLGVSRTTLHKDMTFAKAWLQEALK
jgi:RNA polymerase sigma factor (TIGR02999 family)